MDQEMGIDGLNFDVEDGHHQVHSLILTSKEYIASAFVLFLIWIIGTVGNSLVLLIVAKNKQLRTPINMILLNLAFCDLCMAFMGSPFPMVSAYLNYWPFGDIGCKIYGFGMSLGGIGSINTLMVLAFERFLMISRPCQIRSIEMKHTVGILLGIWMYSLILTIPPLLGWASYDFEGPGISCSVNWESTSKLTTSYITFLFGLGFVLPVIVISGSYYMIIRTLRTAAGEQSRVVNKAGQRVLVMIAAMVLCFLFAWTPYAVVSLMSSMGFQVSPIATLMPAIIAKSSACYNPLIYVGLNTQFRLAWRKLFGLPEVLERDAERETGATGAGPLNTIIHERTQVNSNENQNFVELQSSSKN